MRLTCLKYKKRRCRYRTVEHLMLVNNQCNSIIQFWYDQKLQFCKNKKMS